MRLKKWLCVTLALVTILLLFAGCNPKTEEQIGTDGATKISDLADKKIGIMTGTIFAITMPKRLPDAQYLEFNSMRKKFLRIISVQDHRFRLLEIRNQNSRMPLC